ncbi:MAG TPA: hypothetical protein VGN65_07830, partial [Casimicrobiaceae bacterium]
MTVRNLGYAAALALLALGFAATFPAAAIAPTVTITVPGTGHVPPPTKTPPGEVKLGVYLYGIQDIDF